MIYRDAFFTPGIGRLPAVLSAISLIEKYRSTTQLLHGKVPISFVQGNGTNRKKKAQETGHSRLRVLASVVPSAATEIIRGDLPIDPKESSRVAA